MKDIRLSIIIPVYNVENYLEICINSIIEEITDEDEIILVEDCSTDSSLEICKKIAECHKHIKIIVHDSNKGLSEARNSGIRYAKGRYITFVDSDDHIASGTYKINIPILENDPTIDILEYPVRVHHLSSSNYIYAPGNNKIETFNEWVIRKGYRHSYAWNKIYKKTLWNGTLFPKGKYLEDIFTIPYIIEKAKKIYVSNKGMYYYCLRQKSICGSATISFYKDHLEANSQLFSFIKEKNFLDKHETDVMYCQTNDPQILYYQHGGREHLLPIHKISILAIPRADTAILKAKMFFLWILGNKYCHTIAYFRKLLKLKR